MAVQGLAINRTIQALHLDNTEVGPFIPDEMYNLDQLGFLALKNNLIVGEAGFLRRALEWLVLLVTEIMLSCPHQACQWTS